MENIKICPNCHKEMRADDKFCPYCGSNTNGTGFGAHQLQPNMLLNNKYRINRVIGEGNFGITYLAEDTVLQMKVAIKEFYPKGYVTRESSSSQNITMYEGNKSQYIHKWLENFIYEARDLAKLTGLTGIVEVRDYFEQNSTAYIVMEYLEGDDLSDYIEKYGYTKENDAQFGLGKRLTVDQVKKIMEPVIFALGKVHETGLVHRDISPDNMKFNSSGDLKIFDFGAAREADIAGTSEKTVMLKLGYAPEEQYRKLGNQGPWTDVYALCATIYKCITGIIPIEASERTYKDTLRRPSELGIEIDKNDEDAIMAGLAVYADKRLKDMKALHRALYRDVETPPTPPEHKPSKSLKVVTAIAVAVIAVAAVGTAAYILLPGMLSGNNIQTMSHDRDEEEDSEETSENKSEEFLAEFQDMLDNQQYEELIDELLAIDEDDFSEKQIESVEDMLSQTIDLQLNKCFENADSYAQSGNYEDAFGALEAELAYREGLAYDDKAGQYIDNQVIADKRDALMQEYLDYVTDTASKYADAANEGGIEDLFASADQYFEGQEEYEHTKIRTYSTIVLGSINRMNSQGYGPSAILDYIEENRERTMNNCWVLEMWDFFYSQYNSGAPLLWSGGVKNVSNSGYILDYSDTNELTVYDIQQLSAYELRMALYEIYARHGRIFEDQGVNDYFGQYSWYRPEYSANVFDEFSLSDVERKNIKTILDFETNMGYR